MAADITPSTEAGRIAWNDELREVAARTTDFSSFEVDSIQPPSEETATETETPALTKEAEDQPPQETEDRSNSTEPEAKQTEEPSQDEQNKIPDTNNNKEASVSKRTDPKEVANKNVPYSRFSEVTKEKNEWKTKYEELAKSKGSQPQAEQKPEYAIPPPYEKKPELYKSSFSEEKLEAVLTSGADEETKELARAELSKIHDSERRVTRWEAWEARNAHQWEKIKGEEIHYTQKAVELLPDLNNVDSPAHKQFVAILKEVNQIEPAFMKKPEARFLLAKATKDRLASARMDTVLQENKKLKDEIQTLRKARQPLVATSAPSADEPEDKARPQSVNSLAEKIRLSGVNRG